MITDTAHYHGSFFFTVLEGLDQALSIKRMHEYGIGCYLLAGVLPVYIKHSKSRKGPWTFNFFQAHQEIQRELFEDFGECLTVMICGKDGIVGLLMAEFRQVLNEEFEEQESVTIRRRLNKMYHVKGRDGELDARVGRNSVINKISLKIKKA